MGSESISEVQGVCFFPLITKYNEEGFYGILESLSVHVSKTSEKDKFIIIPSEREIEKKIDEQCKESWWAAIKLAESYVKNLFKFHEVIINFERKEGFYEGNSLGIALTLSFLEQLLKFYNPTYIIKIKEQTTFTGGITEAGKVLSCGEEIIKQKVKAVFFSEMNSFVVAKDDEIPAREQLLELQKEYPNRKLKLIPVEDFADVLNRRDLVEIKKQKLVVRTSKFVRKNWVSAIVTVLLAVLFSYLFVVDWDDNPAFVNIDGHFLQIKNANGKRLWTKKLGIDISKKENNNIAKMLYKFDDLNQDNRSELILCYEFFTQGVDTFNPGRIVCCDFQGKQIWEYVFEDSIFTKGEWQPRIYSSYLVSVHNEGNNKVLYAIASNANFAGALFRLDAVTGKRLNGTLWNAGHFQDAVIGDFNKDGKEEIIMTAINNGLERGMIASINLENLNGQLFTSAIYKFNDIQSADYNKFILLPVSDYAKYKGARYNIINRGGLRVGDDELSFVTVEDSIENSAANLNYRFDFELNLIDVECSDGFQVKRDSLVTQGKLLKPYTNTPEYEKKLRNEIVYRYGLQN